MKLTVVVSDDLIRLAFEGGQPWTSENFFGELDNMFASIKHAFISRPSPVLFDFSRAGHVDSSVVSLLVQAIRLAGTYRVSVVTADHDVMSLFHLMGFHKLADLYPSVETFEAERANVRTQGAE